MKGGIVITGKLLELGATARPGDNFARMQRPGLPDLIVTGLTDNEVRDVAPFFMDTVDLVLAGKQ